MAVTATGQLTGNAAAQLRQMMARLERTRPLIETMTEQAAADQRRNIDERHEPDGTPFKRLSDTTLQLRGLTRSFQPAHGSVGARLTWKGNHANGDAPLKDSGALYESIHPEVRSDTDGWAGPHALDAWYFSFQNQGTARRGNWRPGESVTPGIPARTYIGISILLYDEWEVDVEQFVRAAVDGAA